MDTILPSYYEKPKTAEEVQQSLFNIKETTDNTDEIVINRSVEEYFENPLKDFDKWLETTGKQTQVKKEPQSKATITKEFLCQSLKEKDI